jgi:hypothetical protein
MNPRPKVFLNSSRPLRGFRREGTVIDESPALTVVLQAHISAGNIVTTVEAGGHKNSVSAPSPHPLMCRIRMLRAQGGRSSLQNVADS